MLDPENRKGKENPCLQRASRLIGCPLSEGESELRGLSVLQNCKGLKASTQTLSDFIDTHLVIRA